MPDPGAASGLLLSVGSLCGVKWRPTRFAVDTMHPYVCSLCGVIPKSTHLLPCGHALCDTCKSGGGQDGADGVCPLDQERFGGEECTKIALPARKIDSLKAYCWNQGHGCPFSGALPDVLRHYEEECSFHAVQCPRCGDRVPRAALVAHYNGGCGVNTSGAAAGNEQQRDGGVLGLREVSAALEDFKTLLREPWQDQLPALQTRMNQISEHMENHGALLRQMGDMLRRMCSEEENWERGTRMPWHLEQKHILRRLDVLATESHARVQQARQASATHVEDPVIWCHYSYGKRWTGIPAGASLSCLADKLERQDVVVYGFVAKNARKISEPVLERRIVVGEITEWHCNDVYFTMALITHGEKNRLEVSFQFRATFAGSCSRPSAVSVAIQNENKQQCDLRQDKSDLRQAANGWHQTFRINLSEIKGICEDGTVFFVVTLRG